MSSPIEDYGLIGDGRTAALVCRDGSIDWLCLPRFDSDACLAALLGTSENGSWRIAPAKPGSVQRRYRPDTLVLETEHAAETGSVRVVDFMPIHAQGSAVVRIIEGLSGNVKMQMQLALRSNYGAVAPWFETRDGCVIGEAGSCRFTIAGTIGVRLEDDLILAEFDIAAGETRHITLYCGEAGSAAEPLLEPLRVLTDTENFWRAWISKFDKATHWPEAVKRSLITLKAMIYSPSGGMVAAPTTSLPEAPGGKLNWDYRFSWIRDASFTLSALLNAGFHDEASAWRDWVLRTIGADPGQMRIMYRVNGERHIPEAKVDWLQGYNYAKPVRLGNVASTQHQADVFGELLDAMHLTSQAGFARTPQVIEMATRIVAYIEESWHRPGSGMWESRGEQRHYVYARVMAWVGVDRFLNTPELCDHAGSECVERWQKLRATIHADVCRQGFHPGLGRFVEYYGGQGIDACLLLLPLVNFLPIDDPRISGTIAAVECALLEDGLVRRKPRAGNHPEGTFIACTFWLADCQNMQRRHDAARQTLERVLAIRNDLGLLSEEYDVPGKHLSGNFPQALSHLALINTALGLCGPVLQRGGG